MEVERKPKPLNYWKNWENTKKELEEAIKENNGKFPTQKKLYEMGRSDLANGIIRYHGGFPAVREKIGYNEQVRIKLAKKLEEVVERMVG